MQVLQTEKKEDKAAEATTASTAETALEQSAAGQAAEDATNVEPAAASVAVTASASKSGLDKQYKKRPQVLRGATYKMNTPFGMAYITINDLDGIPSEIFLNVGKAGSDVFAMAEALGRVCSLFLRYGDHGNKVELLIKHLKGIGGTGAIGFGANRVESIADAVAKALETHVANNAESDHDHDPAPVAATMAPADTDAGSESVAAGYGGHGSHTGGSSMSLDLCPSCGGASLINIEGCKTCGNCGYSKCS